MILILLLIAALYIQYRFVTRNPTHYRWGIFAVIVFHIYIFRGLQFLSEGEIIWGILMLFIYTWSALFMNHILWKRKEATMTEWKKNSIEAYSFWMYQQSDKIPFFDRIT